jgi:hypothetical protein
VADIRIQLALERASGVLAGIVAALAQKNLELKTQKLTRASEGRGGELDIRAEGLPGDIPSLADHLASARGVGEVVRIEVDGIIVFFDGDEVNAGDDAHNPFTLDGEPSEDVDSELDAFLEPEPGDDTPPPPLPADTGGFIEADPDWVPASERMVDEPEPRTSPASSSSSEEELGPLLRPIEDEPDQAPSPIGAIAAEVAPPLSEPEPVEASSGWGDEQLDDWADEVDALNRPAGRRQADLGPVEPASESTTSTEAEVEPDSTPEGAGDEQADDGTSTSETGSELSRPPANDFTERGSNPDSSRSDPDRAAATLRRRRRRRR